MSSAQEHLRQMGRVLFSDGSKNKRHKEAIISQNAGKLRI